MNKFTCNWGPRRATLEPPQRFQRYADCWAWLAQRQCPCGASGHHSCSVTREEAADKFRVATSHPLWDAVAEAGRRAAPARRLARR